MTLNYFTQLESMLTWELSWSFQTHFFSHNGKFLTVGGVSHMTWEQCPSHVTESSCCRQLAGGVFLDPGLGLVWSLQ